MKILVFGGSFDPIHHGHLVAANVAREMLGADQVRLVPAANQPFKLNQHAASAGHRARMAELAVAGADGLIVDRAEVERPGPSYTVDTIEDLARRFPGALLSLLLGSDAAEQFLKWRDPERIRARAALVVYARPGDVPPEVAADRIIVVPRMDISSTAVRERVRSGRSTRYWVPDSVAEYIGTHRLYRDERC